VPEDLHSTLRDVGLRVTAQRLAVLRHVARHPHCTADEVERQVGAELGKVSRQAVYDVLAALAQKGLIRRVQPPGLPAIYDPRVGDDHHHVICTRCGVAADVDAPPGVTQGLAAVRSEFRIEAAEVIYRGICPACLAAMAGEPPAADADPS